MTSNFQHERITALATELARVDLPKIAHLTPAARLGDGHCVA